MYVVGAYDMTLIGYTLIISNYCVCAYMYISYKHVHVCSMLYGHTVYAHVYNVCVQTEASPARVLHTYPSFSVFTKYSLSKKLSFMPLASAVTAVHSANAPWTEIQQLVSRGQIRFS